MEDALLFIESQQSWIYLALGLIGLVYLNTTLRAYKDLRRAIFGLERDRSRSRLARSGAMLSLVVAGVVATFVIANFAGPALPISLRPTIAPTVSLLATPETNESVVLEGMGTVGPSTLVTLDGSGCQNPSATMLSPEPGGTVSDVVEFLGVANTPSFAFYKIEYNSLGPGSPWLTIAASTVPVCTENCEEEELLGTWDTTLVTPGDYGVRLVVMDTAGNAPFPCEFLLRVMPQ